MLVHVFMVKKRLDLFSIWKPTVLFKERTGKTLSYISLTSNFYYLQELDNMFLYFYGRAVMDQRFQFLAMVLKVLSAVKLCLVCHDLFTLLLYKNVLYIGNEVNTETMLLLITNI